MERSLGSSLDRHKQAVTLCMIAISLLLLFLFREGVQLRPDCRVHGCSHVRHGLQDRIA